MKGIVIYDSWTGNTKKVAEAIAVEDNFTLTKVDAAPFDLQNYDILILGTPNIRAHPCDKIINYIEKLIPPQKFALFVTFGMPIWGQIFSLSCFKYMRQQLEAKNSQFVGKFMCPGYHVKYKTYKGRPSDKDLCGAKEFGKLILSSI